MPHLFKDIRKYLFEHKISIKTEIDDEFQISNLSSLSNSSNNTLTFYNDSKLIDILIKPSKLLPSSEAQVKLVNKLAVREEIPLSDILSIADIVSIDEMTKQDASKIIDTVMKKNKRSKKKK